MKKYKTSTCKINKKRTSYDHLFGRGHVEQLCLVEAHVVHTTATTASAIFMVQTKIKIIKDEYRLIKGVSLCPICVQMIVEESTYCRM